MYLQYDFIFIVYLQMDRRTIALGIAVLIGLALAYWIATHQSKAKLATPDWVPTATNPVVQPQGVLTQPDIHHALLRLKPGQTAEMRADNTSYVIGKLDGGGDQWSVNGDLQPTYGDLTTKLDYVMTHSSEVSYLDETGTLQRVETNGAPERSLDVFGIAPKLGETDLESAFASLS